MHAEICRHELITHPEEEVEHEQQVFDALDVTHFHEFPSRMLHICQTRSESRTNASR